MNEFSLFLHSQLYVGIFIAVAMFAGAVAVFSPTKWKQFVALGLLVACSVALQLPFVYGPELPPMSDQEKIAKVTADLIWLLPVLAVDAALGALAWLGWWILRKRTAGPRVGK